MWGSAGYRASFHLLWSRNFGGFIPYPRLMVPTSPGNDATQLPLMLVFLHNMILPRGQYHMGIGTELVGKVRVQNLALASPKACY